MCTFGGIILSQVGAKYFHERDVKIYIGALSAHLQSSGAFTPAAGNPGANRFISLFFSSFCSVAFSICLFLSERNDNWSEILFP